MTAQVTLTALFVFICGVFICYQIKKCRVHFLIAVHLLGFWINILLYGAISVAIHEINYDLSILLLTLLLILSYIICFYVLSPKLKKAYNDPIFAVINQIPRWAIQTTLITWLLAKVYLYYKFGIHGFWMLAYREKIGANEIEIIVNTILSHLAFGAVTIFTVKIGMSIRETLKDPFTTLLWMLSLLIFSFLYADLGLGARRTLIIVWVMLLLSIIYSNKKIKIKHILIGSLATLVLINLAILYQNTIRPTIGSTAHLGYISLERTPLSGITGFIGEERYAPIWLLYQVTSEQIDNLRLGQGRLLKHAIMNTIPRAFSPEKHYVDQDELLWGMYNVPVTDLPTTFLVSFQAEISFLAYIIVPAMLILLYKIYIWLLFYFRGISGLLTMVILGNIIMILQSIEASIDTIFVTIRNTLILFLLFFGFYLIKHIIYKPGKSFIKG